MQKNQKNPMIQFREKAERKEGQTDGTEFIRPHYRGSKMRIVCRNVLYCIK